MHDLDPLQNTATHCNTLQHTATHCNTLQHMSMHACSRSTRIIHTSLWMNSNLHTLDTRATQDTPETHTRHSSHTHITLNELESADTRHLSHSRNSRDTHEHACMRGAWSIPRHPQQPYIQRDHWCIHESFTWLFFKHVSALAKRDLRKSALAKRDVRARVCPSQKRPTSTRLP